MQSNRICMFRYLTSYKFYTLAKIGFGLAYLWYIWDFFWIHVAFWNQLNLLLFDPSNAVFSGDPNLDDFLRTIATFLNQKVAVWVFFLISPLVVGLFLWGRHRWLQFVVGCWMSVSIISLTAFLDFFQSSADMWVNFVFVIYGLTALICSTDEWEKYEPGFSLVKWRDDPVLASNFAWLVVLLQFTVYFFAGVNKLIEGWVPWTTGVAIQNLVAFDNSVREFARGTRVPYWLSLILCYVTLLQRLVVPFGFYIKRYRIWSVLILGTMHIGYSILMYVNLFPLIGIASLMMILPPRPLPLLRTSSRQQLDRRKRVQLSGQYALVQGNTLIQGAVICLFSLYLLWECIRLTASDAMPWEKRLMVMPAWKMFSDGGVLPAGEWRLILDTPQGKVDATDISRQPLPNLWRDRFYINGIFYSLLDNVTRKNSYSSDIEPGSLVDRLLQATEKMYRDRQLQLNGNPVVLNASFEMKMKTNNFVLRVHHYFHQGF
jgi:Vitamin K-dependent gamma-carboxylase